MAKNAAIKKIINNENAILEDRKFGIPKKTSTTMVTGDKNKITALKINVRQATVSQKTQFFSFNSGRIILLSLQSTHRLKLILTQKELTLPF